MTFRLAHLFPAVLCVLAAFAMVAPESAAQPGPHGLGGPIELGPDDVPA